MTDVEATLAALEAAGLHRQLREIASAQGPKVTLDGREVLLLCSNDYLGLAGDQRPRDAAAEAAGGWGAGAGASRPARGDTTPRRGLEEPPPRARGPRA